MQQSRAAHRQHIAARVGEARETQPEELLAAILMPKARSEATSIAIDIERLHAIDSKDVTISG